MAQSHICAYCNHTFPITSDTHREYSSSFSLADTRGFGPVNNSHPSEISLNFLKCPNCEEYTIYAFGSGECVKDVDCQIKPKSLAKQFPKYIPQQIKQDYEEAYAIVDLSPKASATLSRRCLQGMIHDFCNIHEKNLNAEISTLKDLIPATQWKVLDGIRSLGNIGAHMEHDINIIVDIDPDEAKKLLKVIEKLLHDWYVERYETETLYNDIIAISTDKQDQRKGK